MDFIELILTVCLAAAPEQCEKQKLQFASQGSVYQCMFEAPPVMAEWSAQHPRWTIVKWRCAPPGVTDTEI